MKRFKKPKNKNITVSEKILKEIKKDAVDTAVGMATLLYLVATKDELGIGYDELVRIYRRVDRYGGYIDNKIVEMKKLAEDLEKDTGIKITWG